MSYNVFKITTSAREPLPRPGHMRLVFAFADGEELDAGFVDATPKGTDATVAAMFGMLRNHRNPPRPRDLTRAAESAYAKTIAGVLYDQLRASQTFERDPEGQERVQMPSEAVVERFSQLGAMTSWRGDCDDVAMRAATILARYGIDPVFCVSGDASNTRDVARFRHILWGWRINPRLPVSRENVVLADSQEGQPIGHWPTQTAVRIYAADAEHSPFIEG